MKGVQETNGMPALLLEVPGVVELACDNHPHELR